MNDYYSQKTTKVRKQWNDMDMYKIHRENCQPRILQSVKISFNKWGLNKFLDKTDGTLIIQREINITLSKYVDIFFKTCLSYFLNFLKAKLKI